MRRTLSTLAFAVVLAAPATAQQGETVEDLVAFFASSVDLGRAKGLCVGTPQECARTQVPEGRDMLVNFDLGSAELTDATQDRLGVFVQAMQDDRLMALQFAVEGHTDGRGTEVYNDALSADRARAVKEFLVAQGIAPDRLTAFGLGETQPRTDDIYDPQNRRVELRVDLR